MTRASGPASALPGHTRTAKASTSSSTASCHSTDASASASHLTRSNRLTGRAQCPPTKEAKMTKVIVNLRDLLICELGGTTTHIPATVDVDDLMEFSDIANTQIDIDELLRQERKVASVWALDQVFLRRPDLTDEQAWDVLQHARNAFELDGVHLDYLESTADGLFPPPSSAKVQLATRTRNLLRRIDLLPDEEASDPAGFATVAATLDAI